MSLRSPQVMIALLVLLLGGWYYLDQTGTPEETASPAQATPASAPVETADLPAASADRFDYVLIDNLFPSQSWQPPQKMLEAVTEPVFEVEPPPEPVAPRLPYTYLGRMQEDNEEAVIFVTRNDVVYSIQSGDVLDGTWKLSQVHSYGLEWTYLPLNMTHIIRTPL